MIMDKISEDYLKKIKASQMDELSAYRKEKLYKAPELRQLFFELTMKCNENCFHCGSGCDPKAIHGMPARKYKEILDEVKENFDISRLQLAITGGEPLLYPDFFEVLGYAHNLGYKWGMTSNGTLITKEVAKKLHECGMGTISISIDGLPDTHDRQRGLQGGYEMAMRGIKNLIEEGGFNHIQVTTVFNHKNIDEIDEIYDIMLGIDIDSWRVIGIEPIGRALQHPDYMLTTEDQKRLFDFIKEKREEQMPVTYGCSHFLGLDYEREVRKWYFLCNAGVYVASIMANGDVGACLDIERRPETIQGNVYKENFTDIWKNRFEIFRKPLSPLNEKCSTCEYEKWCAGGAAHSWDYDQNEQRICMKDILFR